MKKYFIIPIHSFSDLITNSSTDIFACGTKKSVEAVKTLLTELLVVSRGTSEVSLDSILDVYEDTLANFYSSVDDYMRDVSFDEFIKQFKSPYCEEVVPVTGRTKIVVVEGNSDNSIPYWLMEFIESELNGYKVHEG
jgi:hypothetical protein